MTSYQQRPGGKFLEVDRRRITHENEMIEGFPLRIVAPGVSRGDLGWKSWFCIYWLKTLLI